MRWAVIVLAILAPHQAMDTAGRRLRGEAHAIGDRVRGPRKRHNSGVPRLDERAFRERAAAVAQELAGDRSSTAVAGVMAAERGLRVAASDALGHESLVSAYVNPPRPLVDIKTK